MSGAVFAGQLRRRVILQIPKTTTELSGFQPRIYVDGPQVWVHIKPVRNFERFFAERPQGVVTHHITLRSLPDFSAGFRFVLGARVFHTLSFEDCEGVPAFIRAYCEEVQPWA